ncbi:GNAT family N-acetyltransferase [Actinoplanes sp. NPDC089786]|uniref:GNAT family N-acetyltransferase n=1 Tax=Actinoplanes sp. NPDC089786 TaxID=3155185 RepID=UPI00343EA012
MTQRQSIVSVYTEELPGLGTFELVRLDPAAHLDTIYAWVSARRAEFWGMTENSRDEVREIYEFLDGLETHHAYLMELDGTPIGIFQTYEPEHDPIGEYYPVRAGDFGIHLFLAPAEKEIQDFTGTVSAALLRFVFQVPARQRIVVEPDARNERALRRWKRLGFVFDAQVTLPHKTAQLAFLERSSAGR